MGLEADLGADRDALLSLFFHCQPPRLVSGRAGVPVRELGAIQMLVDPCLQSVWAVPLPVSRKLVVWSGSEGDEHERDLEH